MHSAPEHRVHHPVLELIPPDPRNRSVVIDPQQDAATLEIGERYHFLRQLLGAQVVALELDPGVLTIRNQREQLGSGHLWKNSLNPRRHRVFKASVSPPLST